MADTELETTLIIKPKLDPAAKQALADEVAAAVAGVSVGGTGRGGMGSTTSTANASPGGQVGPPDPTRPWNYPGGMAGSTTTSTAAAPPPGGGGSGPPGGGGPGGGRGGRSLWSDLEIADMGRVNRARPDMRNYLAGQGYSDSARTLLGGMAGGNTLGGVISTMTTAFGNSAMSAARSRAQEIEDARAMGTPESMIGGMGALRFAGPIGAAASVLGGYAVNNISEGLSLQERISRSYAADARAQGNAINTGAQPANWTPAQFYTNAAMAENGGLNQEQARAARNAYAQIGFYDRNPIDYMKTAMTGVEVSSIAAYRANARYGSDPNYAGQAQINNAIGAGQGFSLQGAGLDQFIQQIAQNTRQMANRGVRVDQDSLNSVLNRAVDRGLSPEIAATAAGNMGNNVLSLRDQALAPFKAYGDALIMQRALRGANSIGDYATNLENLAGDNLAINDTLTPGGVEARAAYGGVGMRNALDNGRGTKRPTYTFDTTKNYDAWDYAQSVALGDAVRQGAMQDPGSFRSQQSFAAGSDARSMQWGFVSEFKGVFGEAFNGLGARLDAQAVQNSETNSLLRSILTALDRK